MRRGTRGGRQNQPYQSDENWMVKPLHQDTLTTTLQANLEPPSTVPSTSHQNLEPSTTLSFSDFIPKTPKHPPNRRTPKWTSQDRRSHVVKPRFVKKSELDSSSSSKEGDGKEEEEEDCRDGHGGVNELSSSNCCEEDNGHKGLDKLDEETETIGGSDSINDVDDIASRLEELRLGGKAPELSEEELRINDQLQEDELLAMESIYGDNIFIHDKQGGLRSFQIHVHIEAPKELTISAKLNSSSDIETKTDGSPEFSYSFKVQYLPPIVLTCLLPKSYPSHCAPYFTISIQWLDSAKISNFCSMMDSVWKEQPGQEVIYQWVEWLHSSSLSYIGFDKEIILGPYGMRHSGDRRAISGCVSPDVDIPSMKSYNNEQHHVNFCKNLHECCICFSEFAGNFQPFPGQNL